ncbi:hypothetical protein BT96DRAFT_988309 [Gymnopus androsaceus JB14]|uniref:Uncharacterized protein n=1 Tax=Gymnopus androsaceus JB14 TaxID=1447944 RepID=A0A6A4I8W2_9AGAR|nr:hypothetical protein BT96DRAFT_988309 [Gymnopus androsaceus JB14]
MFVNVEDSHTVLGILQNAIQTVSPTTIDPSAVTPLSVDIIPNSATTPASPPKLKPLIIPELGSVALGLLTPVDETPDDAESTNQNVYRSLPVPKIEFKRNRPRARSLATWSAESRTLSTSHSNRDVLLDHPSAHTLVSSGQLSPGVSSKHLQRSFLSPSNSDNTTLWHVPHSGVSRNGTREGRSSTVSYSVAKPALAGRISAPKLSHQRSSLPSPPERQFISRARANTSATVPKHQVQSWIASPTAVPNTAPNPPFETHANFPGPKVKALPRIPVVVDNTLEQTRNSLEGRRPLTAKEKGKGRAFEVLPISQNVSQTGTGLLTPPESANTPFGASPNSSTLSSMRVNRPRGPRTRRSTIC